MFALQFRQEVVQHAFRDLLHRLQGLLPAVAVIAGLVRRVMHHVQHDQLASGTGGERAGPQHGSTGVVGKIDGDQRGPVFVLMMVSRGCWFRLRVTRMALAGAVDSDTDRRWALLKNAE